jgi:hypothetical protein
MTRKANSNPSGGGPKVYLVEDQHNSPGKIYAVFSSETDAENFASFFKGEAGVIERTLFFGQPPHIGYCE